MQELNFHPIENSSETANICVPILIEMYKPKSVIDFGCNVGWWLKSFMDNGVTDVIGFDGHNMIPELKIPRKNFSVCDLTVRALVSREKRDLLICLEVADHLDEKFANKLVKNAINCGKTIIWSAATKGQGGYNHVNEQPLEYWINKFKAHGYKHRLLCDVLPEFPHDYYRKNAIEFTKE